MTKKDPRQLTAEQQEELLGALEARFKRHMKRHPKVAWDTVLKKVKADRVKLWSLDQMEQSGGEPDVVGNATKDSGLVFMDCSPESPSGRRSVCYDREGLESRKDHRPKDTATDMAAAMGIDLLTEDDYRALQHIGEFDTKTSSWLKTPDAIRNLGGALFGDFRYGQVFVYHNGAQSYYAARGFRGKLVA